MSCEVTDRRLNSMTCASSDDVVPYCTGLIALSHTHTHQLCSEPDLADIRLADRAVLELFRRLPNTASARAHFCCCGALPGYCAGAHRLAVAGAYLRLTEQCSDGPLATTRSSSTTLWPIRCLCAPRDRHGVDTPCPSHVAPSAPSLGCSFITLACRLARSYLDLCGSQRARGCVQPPPSRTHTQT